MIAKHKANLLKLADYLETLPDDYERFHMHNYMAERDQYGWKPLHIFERRKPECGTVACAVGHGPAAGIRIYGDWNWSEYADRVFGKMLIEDFHYMFGSEWSNYDNTPKGAASRIRTFVSLGSAPEDWSFEDAKVAA